MITRYMGQWLRCSFRSFWASCHNHLKTIHGQQTRQTKISEHNFIASVITWWDSKHPKKKRLNPRKKMAKKQYKCKGWSIPNICAFLQQGNGPTNGVEWQRRKWGPRDNILGRYHDRFGGGT